MLLNVFIPRPPPLPPSTPAFIHEKHRTRKDDIDGRKRRNLLSTPVPARGSAAFAMRPSDFSPQSPPPLRMIISALLLLCVGARETMSGRKGNTHICSHLVVGTMFYLLFEEEILQCSSSSYWSQCKFDSHQCKWENSPPRRAIEPESEEIATACAAVPEVELGFPSHPVRV